MNIKTDEVQKNHGKRLEMDVSDRSTRYNCKQGKMAVRYNDVDFTCLK
jgi:membrane-bound inhibitor of C-type lysozyme